MMKMKEFQKFMETSKRLLELSGNSWSCYSSLGKDYKERIEVTSLEQAKEEWLKEKIKNI